MQIEPATRCCGCCCALRPGVMAGAVIHMLFALIGASLSFGFTLPYKFSDHVPRTAEKFCNFSDPVRDQYAECWSDIMQDSEADICVCGSGRCDFYHLQ